MWEPDYDKHAKYWLEKDAVSNKNGKTIEYLRKNGKENL